jgi:23S rRNA pseudouridine2605 synthase
VPMRLNKFLAKAGIASRRRADLLIEERHVSINGTIITNLGTQVDEANDVVLVDGKPAIISPDFVYLMLHKPNSYLVTRMDEFGRKTVMSLIGKYHDVAKPVGRLDLNSSGLLIFTNDGELAFRLTHPRFKIDKTYHVKCEGYLTEDEAQRLEKGVAIEGGITAPAKITIISQGKDFSRFEITIHEGKKRQVRLMCLAVKHEVIALKRLTFGNLQLGDLKEGKYRILTDDEVRILKGLVGL